MSAEAKREKTAIVVGASRGLGLGLAKELLSRGWKVIATGRNLETASALKSLISQSQGRLTLEQIDVDQPAHLTALANRIAATRFDLLFINAGVSGPPHQSVDEVTPEELTALFTTNTIAPLRVARRLLPQVNDGGTIAFMSSRLGSIGDNTAGGFDLYRASKAALNTLTRSFVANIVGDKPISVLTLHPGWVRTDMGGESAPLSVDESVRGVADVLEAPRTAKHVYVDYQGNSLLW
jgi:NAD(P)-dependent dehydrogenase (short-subunit alcohol dehydrogenase family)